MSRIVEIMSLSAAFENHQSVVCIKSDRMCVHISLTPCI